MKRIECNTSRGSIRIFTLGKSYFHGFNFFFYPFLYVRTLYESSNIISRCFTKDFWTRSDKVRAKMSLVYLIYISIKSMAVSYVQGNARINVCGCLRCAMGNEL